jgi:hypothetical protein
LVVVVVVVVGSIFIDKKIRDEGELKVSLLWS